MHLNLSSSSRAPVAARCRHLSITVRGSSVAFRSRQQARDRFASHLTRVAEATGTAQQVDESTTGASASDEKATSAIERAKSVLQSESLDKASLEAALADLEGEMAEMMATVTAAESRATALEATAATAKDQLLRLNADFENFRRRTREEKDQLVVSVRGDVVTSLLPVIDNFELARTNVKAETEGELKINNSYQGLYKQFVDFLRGLGVEAVPSVGSPFDPNVHEAIMKEENNEVADNTVLEEFRKGFKLGDKLLRPAMVKVSTSDFPPVSSQEE